MDTTHTPHIGPVIGLTAAERQRASIGSYVAAVVANNQKELQFFRELSDQVARASGAQQRSLNAYMVPGDVTVPGAPMKRDLTATGGGSSGGFMVGTQIQGFASALDAASVLSRLPVTRLPNMTGNVTITRETVKGTAGWLATEGVSTIPTAESTYGALSLAPKTIAGSVTVSRLLSLQAGPAGNAFIERALATTTAEAVDRALIAGSGSSGQPLGLVGISGIDSRAGTSFALADAAAMLRVAEGWAASDSIRWLAGVAAAEDLRVRLKSANGGETLMDDNGRMLGRDVIVSRSVGDQVLVCMPWAQLWFASWGALEISADPFTNFRTGHVTVRCLWTVDHAVERAASVAVATALT